MKFSDLPQGWFVVSNLSGPSVLMAKDTKGQIRLSNYELVKDHGVAPETEVQEVHLK